MDIAAAWERAIAAVGDTDKPADESVLKLARDGHPNARAIVARTLDDCDCYTCGPLEECPDATPAAFAKREALRTLGAALGVYHPEPKAGP